MYIIYTLLVILLTFVTIIVYFRMLTVSTFSVIFLLILLLYSGTFIVTEGEQVVITQFGEIIGNPYVKPGLYFKVPFIWKANFFDKRIFTDAEYNGKTPTRDGYLISVDTVFNWKIVNAKAFIDSMNSISKARQMLKNLVSGSVRQNIANEKLIEIIRSFKLDEKDKVSKYALPESKNPLGADQAITTGRSEMTFQMRGPAESVCIEFWA